MLTSAQHEEFERMGLVRLPGAIPVRDAEEMRDRVWESLLGKYGVRHDAPETWKGQRFAGLHHLPASLKFEQIGSAVVCDATDDLLGRGIWQRPERWGSLLVTFPESKNPWQLPHQGWHLDFPLRREASLSVLRIFTCLAPLPAGGGGTLFVAGSHQLVRKLGSERQGRLRSAQIRDRLVRAHPWVNDLCNLNPGVDRVHTFMNTASMVGDVEVRVVEMTGEPGDVLLSHPMLLHAGSPNCAATPRMVLSSTIHRADVRADSLYQ